MLVLSSGVVELRSIAECGRVRLSLIPKLSGVWDGFRGWMGTMWEGPFQQNRRQR